MPSSHPLLPCQVLSTGADGLAKLWNVASGECVNTFDEHEDKVRNMLKCL